MSAAITLDLPVVPPSRRIRLTMDLPSAAWEVPVTLDLEGRVEPPAIVVRAPRRAPEAPQIAPGGPRPTSATPIARIPLVATPMKGAPRVREARAAAPIAEPAVPEPARTVAMRVRSTARGIVFGGTQALLGLAATTFALVEFAEISIVDIFGGAFGGPAISLAGAMFFSLVLLALNLGINLLALRLTKSPMLLVGTLLAVPLSIGLFDTVQDGLTVFGYYIQGGRGVHPTVLRYQNPQNYPSTGL